MAYKGMAQINKKDLWTIPNLITYFRIIGANYLLNTGMIMATNMLRCMGDTRTPLKFNILTNLVNVVGNFLMIYPTRQLTVLGMTFTMPGAGWGVGGAAAATALATAFSAVCLLSVLFLFFLVSCLHLCRDSLPAR